MRGTKRKEGGRKAMRLVEWQGHAGAEGLRVCKNQDAP